MPVRKHSPQHTGDPMANPNPSPETRFQPGNPGGGKTAEQKRLEYEAAEMAAKARHKLLSVITEKLASMPDDVDDLTKILSADMLRLFKDSEDRAHGTPKATTESTVQVGGSLAITRTIVDPKG